MTIDKALREGTEKIGRRDALLLLAHISGYSTSGVILHALKELDAAGYAAFRAYVKRRLAGEPLQYIIGQWEFMGLNLITDKRALIPRPETELLVEEALEFILSLDKNEIRVLDVCTGSGCIAIAVACLTGEHVKITAADISPDALSLARENAVKHPSANRVDFIESDLLEKFFNEKFDVIISNPPYILSGDMAELPPSVRNHEPHVALNGGDDGLDIYRRLIPQCKNALHSGGALFLEIGPPAVMDLMGGFDEINLRRDYAEIERIVSGVLKAQI